VSHPVQTVFLSYARSDRAVAEVMMQRLRDHGIEVFREDDIPAGADLHAALKEGLRRADVFIALVTPAFVGSDWARAELGAAWMLDKRILPVVTDMRLLARMPDHSADSEALLLGPDVDEALVRALEAA
jgi:hypothetical protein